MHIWSLGQEDSLEQDMATHSSILVWRIPRTEELGGLQVIGSQRVRHDWSNLACTRMYKDYTKIEHVCQNMLNVMLYKAKKVYGETE